MKKIREEYNSNEQQQIKMGFKWGQELLKAKTIIAEQHQIIEELKGEIAIIKTPLLERANGLLKKINPTISVSGKNSITKLTKLILELERMVILEVDGGCSLNCVYVSSD
jgi:hypothetical protein